jgi:hypothetical protein
VIFELVDEVFDLEDEVDDVVLLLFEVEVFVVELVVEEAEEVEEVEEVVDLPVAVTP